MKISDSGLDLIIQFEGLKTEAYPDPGSGGMPWTVGVGHTKGVRAGDRCTEEQAMDWLREDVGEAEQCIARLVRVPLTQPEFDALVSLIFNIGSGNFRSSTLLKKLNALDYEGASLEFRRWDRAAGMVMAGLTRRRNAEAELFMQA